MSDVQTTGQWVLLLMAFGYLLYKIFKLPKGVRNFTLAFLGVSFTIFGLMAFYYPEPLIKLMNFTEDYL